MRFLKHIVTTVPERHRWKFYMAGFMLFVLILAALLVVDLLQGGDAGDWLLWLAGVIGLGTTGTAAANTDRWGS